MSPLREAYSVELVVAQSDALLLLAEKVRDAADGFLRFSRDEPWNADLQIVMRYSLTELMGAAARARRGVFSAMVDNLRLAADCILRIYTSAPPELLQLQSSLEAAAQEREEPQDAVQDATLWAPFQKPALRLATQYPAFEAIRRLKIRQNGSAIYTVTLQ